jgi:hypothetical protein
MFPAIWSFLPLVPHAWGTNLPLLGWLWHCQVPMIISFPVFPHGNDKWNILDYDGKDCSDHGLQLSENASSNQTIFPCLIGFCGGATCNLLHRLHYNGLCSSKLDQPICLFMKPLRSKSGGNSGPPIYGPTQFSLLLHQWYLHISSIHLPVVHTH